MSPSPSEPPPDDSNPSQPAPPAAATTLAARLFQPLRSSMTTEQESEPSPSSMSDPNLSHDNPEGVEPIWSQGSESGESSDPGPSGAILSIGKSGKLSRAGLRTAIGGAVRRVCRLVAIVAADDEERALGVWHPDPEDIEDIAEPAASLVWRRVPADARGGDAMDILQLSLAIAGYVGKNVKRRAEIRAARRFMAESGYEPTAENTAGHFEAGADWPPQ